MRIAASSLRDLTKSLIANADNIYTEIKKKAVKTKKGA
jgi:hypothetical protein